MLAQRILDRMMGGPCRIRLGLGLGVGWMLVCWTESGPAMASAAEPRQARLVASTAPGWPQWRGPRRDGVSDETGLLQSWPDGGPRVLWKREGLGRGYSAPIVTGGRIYLAGDVDGELRILALGLDGGLVWQATNGGAWKGPYPGARASCTYQDGRLFHMNALGRLACLDAATGRELWFLNVLERFEGKNITWGLSECLLVDGKKVLVTAGGNQALMAALDVETGKVVWTTPALRLGSSEGPLQQRLATPAGEADSASYSSPILFTLGGRRQIVNCSLRHVFGVDADTGALLWTRPFPTRYSVIAASPVLAGDAVFVTAPDSGGGQMHRLLFGGQGEEVTRLWTSPLDTGQGGVVHVDGLLFGSWYRSRKGWAGIDAATGQVRLEVLDMAMGPVVYADRRLFWLSQEGEMTLLEPGADRFELKGRFRLVAEKQNDVWTHPVILDGHMYLRHHEQLWCYDVRGRSN